MAISSPEPAPSRGADGSLAPLDLSKVGRRPVRSFFALLDATVWNQLGMALLYFIKASPGLLLPVLLAESIRVVGAAVPGSSVRLAWMYAAFGLILAANIPLHMLYIRRSSKRLRTMELRLRAALVRRLQQLSMAYHAGRESGRLQSKVLRDVDEVVRLGDTYFQQIIGAVVSLAFAFAYTLAQEPLMTLGYIVAAPLAVGITHAFRGAMQRRNEALRVNVESMSQRVSEMIDMVPVTRAHGLEDVEMEAMNVQLESVRTTGRRVDNVNAFFASSSWVVFMATIAAVTGAAAWLALNGQVTVDKIALYSALFQMVVFSLSNLLNMMPQISKSIVSIRSIGEVLECPDVEANEGRRQVRQVQGRIEFDHVTFSYPGKGEPAVDHFSLAIEPGECVAFVGESGGGKSTLMQLAIGFLRPQSGRILLDGLPMEELDMRSWRRHIAVVPQQTILFSGTLRDNITYGMPGYTAGQIESVVEAARLGEFIRQLPEGMDTPVGENGLRLSGGQRQRIAIARALIRNPRVIILDEATSALDSVSEHAVQQAINELVRARTTLIVAHRLSTIRDARRVVVMAGGRAVESGTPADLAKRNGPFATLAKAQFGAAPGSLFAAGAPA
jgi:ATP-binding cassette, subfamily B, bacterial